MRDFFESRRFKILIVIAVFLSGVMAYAGANGRLTAAPQEVLSVLVEPFQWVAAKVSDGAGSLWHKYTSVDDVMAENEALKEENKTLKEQLVDYDKVVAENDAYKSLEAIQEANPNRTYASAFVIGRDTLDEFGGFTLDVGTAQGVARGDTVVSNDGYLVGIVQEANLTSCKVMTVLHPSFAAASVVSRTRDNGILCGDSAYASQGLCTMTNIARDTMATAGDMVITTGLGGVYPPDIMVGSITELIPESSGKSVVAVVEPGVDIETLTHVFIITDY